jgi:hypothetical protein
MTMKINAIDGTVHGVRSDRPVGHKGANGYVYVYDGGKQKLAHRLIFESVNGKIPDGMEIDHINGIRDDNRIANLRLVNKSQNQQNRSAARADSRSGQKGVFWHKSMQKWAAKIKVGGRCIWLGYRDSLDAAKALYAEAALRYHTHNPSAAGA